MSFKITQKENGQKLKKLPRPSTWDGVKIVYEDADVLVIDKPAGLVVHPSQPPRHKGRGLQGIPTTNFIGVGVLPHLSLKGGGSQTHLPAQAGKSGTLVDILLTHYPQIKNVGESPLRPGIVHRLDKDTSGVLIIAKNNPAFQYIKRQFQQRKIVKKYLALVIGQPPQNQGTINTYLARDQKDKTKQKALTLPLAKGKVRQAITEYKVIKKYKNYTLLEARPKTGRLHQLRAQLKWLGCPVAGDKKYSKKKQPCPEGLKRQFLHAISLKLKLPNGQLKEYKSPLPLELENTLRGLQKE